MTITATGFVLMVVSAVLICRKWQSLLLLAIFFSAFSATSLVNIKAVTFGITPYIYFSALYCLLGILMRAYRWPVPDSPFRSTVLGGVAAFSLLVLASTLGAAIQGRVGLASVTQSAYLLLGVAMTCVTAFVLQDSDTRRSAFEFLRYGGIAVSLWGVLQIACSYSGIEYPTWIFNNSISDFADMYDQKSSAGVQRIASVAVEPSFLAFSLVHVFAFSSSRMLWGGNAVRRRELATVVLTGMCLLLSTSTTAYVGLAACFLVLACTQPSRAIVACLAAGLILGALLFFYDGFADMISEVTVRKFDTWSFQDRYEGTQRGIEIFLHRPLLGGGWGATQDILPIFLLATVGLLGTAAFLVSVTWTLLGTARALATKPAAADADLWLDCMGCQIALYSSLAMSIASGFKYVVFDYWFMWGAAIAVTATIFQRQRSRQKRSIVVHTECSRPGMVDAELDRQRAGTFAVPSGIAMNRREV